MFGLQEHLEGNLAAQMAPKANFRKESTTWDLQGETQTRQPACRPIDGALPASPKLPFLTESLLLEPFALLVPHFARSV